MSDHQIWPDLRSRPWVVRALNGGTVTTGKREIEPGEAAVVECMFREFIAGVSPKQIAKNLNREGVPGPFGGPWGPSTIYGNAKRGTGSSTTSSTSAAWSGIVFAT